MNNKIEIKKLAAEGFQGWCQIIVTFLICAMAGNGQIVNAGALPCANGQVNGPTNPPCGGDKGDDSGGGGGGGAASCPTSEEGSTEDPTADSTEDPTADPNSDDSESSSSQGTCEGGSLSGGLNFFDPYSGNAARQVNDLELFGGVGMHKLALRRSSSTRLGSMGVLQAPFGKETGWSHNYNWLLRAAGVGPNGVGQMRLAMPSGGDVLFRQQLDDSDLWLPAASSGRRLYRNGNDFVMQNASGWRYSFEQKNWSTGGVYYRLSSFEDPLGNVYTITYVGEGRDISRVTEPGGRWLEFSYADAGEYTSSPKVLATVTNPAAGQWIEVNIPSTKNYRYFALRVTNNWKYLDSLPVAELEFVKELDESGDPVLLTGTSFGSDPALAVGEEYDKASDGSTSSFFRYAYKRNGFVGIDLGEDNNGEDVKMSVLKVRFYIADTGSSENANFQILGMENLPSDNLVIDKVTGSDGREVTYQYTPFTDAGGQFTWTTLSGVSYADGTQSSYNYEQVHPFSRPVLKQSIDPRVSGRGTNIEYGFNPDTPIGFVTEERNGATGDLLASAAMIGVHSPQVVYPDGRTLTAYYQLGNARVQRVVDGLGNETQLTYDQGGLGFTASRTDALGNTTSYERTEFGRIKKMTRADGSSITYGRDNQQRLLSKTVTVVGQPDRVTTWTRNGLGQKTQQINPDGSIEQWSYNGFGQKLTQTSKNGAIASWQYDATGLKTKYTDALGNEMLYSYNAIDQIATKTDSLGAVTAYEYNDAGNVTKITYPDGGIVTNGYDDFQNLISRTDEQGNTSSVTYDSLKRELTSTDALGRTTIFGYGLGTQGCASCGILSQPTRVTYPDGRVVKRSLDFEWRVISETDAFEDALAVTTSTSYDAVGNVVTQTDYNGNVTTFGYDSRNRRISVTDALGQTTNFVLDAHGNALSTTRPDGSVISATYDEQNRALSSTDAEGDATSYSYNDSGTVASVTDALGRETSYSYDDLDRNISATYADGSTSSTSYGSTGNVISQTDALGKVTNYSCCALI